MKADVRSGSCGRSSYFCSKGDAPLDAAELKFSPRWVEVTVRYMTYNLHLHLCNYSILCDGRNHRVTVLTSSQRVHPTVFIRLHLLSFTAAPSHRCTHPHRFAIFYFQPRRLPYI